MLDSLKLKRRWWLMIDIRRISKVGSNVVSTPQTLTVLSPFSIFTPRFFFCSVVTLAVPSITSVAMDRHSFEFYRSKIGSIHNPSCSACDHPPPITYRVIPLCYFLSTSPLCTTRDLCRENA